MKATAVAPANIAFIKYWGKADDVLRLPLNSSISMNLSGAQTVTTVEFANRYTSDRIEMVGEKLSPIETERIVRHLDLIRQQAKSSLGARVVTKNSFPKGVGSASSASGFAALTLSACAALGLHLSEKELTILARLGSGSACRSIPDGFVLWQKGSNSDSSYAFSLYLPDHWELRDVLVVVQRESKKVSSTSGMEKATSSPLWEKRLRDMDEKIAQVKRALKIKDMRQLGEIIEAEALNLHAAIETQSPPLRYWTDTTRRIMEEVRRWRKDGLLAYFTIDAGPNVHLICESQYTDSVLTRVKSIKGVASIIVNHPAKGARLIDEHLF